MARSLLGRGGGGSTGLRPLGPSFLGRTLLILLLTLGTTGCLGKDEPNRLGIVLAVGLDAAPQGVKLTVEVARPVNAGQIVGIERNSTLLSAEAPTVPQAVDKIETGFSRRLFWPDTEVLLAGEDLARQGLEPWLDYFKILHSFHRRVWFLVTKGPAAALLASRPIMERSVGDELRRAIEKRIREGPDQVENLNEFWIATREEGNDPMTVMVARDPSQALDLGKGAVFRGDRLAGRLNREEVQGFALWQGTYPPAVLVADKGNGRLLATKVLREKVHRNFRADGRPDFDEEIQLTGLVESATIPRSLWTTTTAEEALHLVQRTVSAEARYDSDFLGLGREIFRHDPKRWEQLQPHWRRELSLIQVHLRVIAGINAAGERAM